jgi:hypothetical protein
MVFRYILETKSTVLHELRYWIENGQGRFRGLVDRELVKFQEWLENAHVTETSYDSRSAPSDRLANEVRENFSAWTAQQLQNIPSCSVVDDSEQESASPTKGLREELIAVIYLPHQGT